MGKNNPLLLYLIINSVLIFLYINPVSLSAHVRTDFSGEWKLDESRSDLGNGNYRNSASVMTVQQQDNELNFVRISQSHTGREMKVYENVTLDGKETGDSTNSRIRKSSARWSADGTSLTINTHLEFRRNENKLSFNIVEVWELQNPNTLVINYTVNTSRGERTRRFIYNKT